MKEENLTTGLMIVVLDRGFVYVGDAEYGTTGHLIIKNASNVRRWGTQDGLGQLALKGPQKNTELDFVGTVRAPMNAVIHTIDCDRAAWNA